MKTELYNELINNISSYMSKKDISLVKLYYETANKIYKDKIRNNNISYIEHSLNLALYLSKLNMDAITIGSALIHEVYYINEDELEEIKDQFGIETYITLSSLKNIEKIKSSFTKSNDTEKYRKIIVNLSENPSSIIIKLVDRLQNLETIDTNNKKYLDELIEETNKVYIPIAHRLGIKKIKSELEDVCLRLTHPKEYKDILLKLNASRSELENDLAEMKSEIIKLLNEHNIKFDITARVKSVRGIYNKLIIGKKWEQIYDFLGLRIIVDKIEECYLVIGLIHSKYKFLPHRFKDFIANAKSNMYQSIHTTVFGYNGQKYEIQVRTHEMDEIAEHGIAAHWSYKEKVNANNRTIVENKLEAFRSLIELNDKENNINFFKNLDEFINKEEIYCFTPKGDIIELPKDSTPVDFAYKIHSEVGNTTTGALVNGKMVKLNYKLHESDIVEIITQKDKTPNKTWLKFVVSDQAKSRIKSFFYKKEREKLIETGKQLLESEIKKEELNINEILSKDNINKCLELLSLKDVEDIYISIATLKYSPHQIINKIHPIEEEVKFIERKNIKNNNDILVEGQDNILTTIAKCCNPVFGEKIVGYITKGEGIKIHSENCKNVDLENDKIIEVSWNKTTTEKSIGKLKLFILKGKDELLNIITLATKLDINVISFNEIKNTEDIKEYELQVKIKNITILNEFILKLKENKNIKDVIRG